MTKAKQILIVMDDNSLKVNVEGIANTLELIGLFALAEQELLAAASETLTVTTEITPDA